MLSGELWSRFMTSGAVEAYLEYRAALRLESISNAEAPDADREDKRAGAAPSDT